MKVIKIKKADKPEDDFEAAQIKKAISNQAGDIYNRLQKLKREIDALSRIDNGDFSVIAKKQLNMVAKTMVDFVKLVEY